jgi:hypothetical protein
MLKTYLGDRYEMRIAQFLFSGSTLDEYRPTITLALREFINGLFSIGISHKTTNIFC